MMNKKQYFLALIGSVVFVLCVFAYLHDTQKLQLPKSLFWTINAYIFGLYTLGGAIVIVGKKALKEVFAQRFLMMTTFHFLAIFGVLIAVWYNSKEHLRSFSLQFISVFLLLMIVNSLLLLRLIKEKNNMN